MFSNKYDGFAQGRFNLKVGLFNIGMLAKSLSYVNAFATNLRLKFLMRLCLGSQLQLDIGQNYPEAPSATS